MITASDEHFDAISAKKIFLRRVAKWSKNLIQTKKKIIERKML